MAVFSAGPADSPVELSERDTDFPEIEPPGCPFFVGPSVERLSATSEPGFGEARLATASPAPAFTGAGPEAFDTGASTAISTLEGAGLLVTPSVFDVDSVETALLRIFAMFPVDPLINRRRFITVTAVLRMIDVQLRIPTYYFVLIFVVIFTYCSITITYINADFKHGRVEPRARHREGVSRAASRRHTRVEATLGQ
jgi:hypothetical protein